MEAESKLRELLQGARSLCDIANMGRKREGFPGGRQYADDTGELGQWILADKMTELVAILERLLQPPSDKQIHEADKYILIRDSITAYRAALIQDMVPVETGADESTGGAG